MIVARDSTSNGINTMEAAPYTYRPGFIILSYFISVIGAWVALELLHRRTSRGGRYNWFLLGGAATAMGGVSIWAMHFIGMQAIDIGGGDPVKGLVYSPGYTVGSFFLPIGFMAVAFFILSASENVKLALIMAGGFVCGGAICGMHYLGQAGVINYVNVWDWRYVLGSAIISVVAATVALGIFFHLRSIWTNTIWKRMCSAFLLATAVSLMHWTASLGTTYVWRGGVDQSTGFGTTGAVWVCGGLALICCAVLISLALFWQFLLRRYAQQAQQVVLALATWDPEGKLMLNPAGFLPCQRVTKSYIEKSFQDVFDTNHVVFNWIFRVSRCWSSVGNLIPGMRRHIRQEDFSNRHAIPKPDSLASFEDYALTFKELFCVAAQDLASTISQPVDQIGVLYDRIVDTGTVAPKIKVFSAPSPPSSLHDVETGQRPGITLGRGQLLFLVRHVNRSEASQLQAAGFNFAPVSSVLDHLAFSMQITPDELRVHLTDLVKYKSQPQLLEPGVHVCCFALRPVVRRGFDILARKDARNLLPSIKLSIDRLEQWQADILATYDNWEVTRLHQEWTAQVMDDSTATARKAFLSELVIAMERMSDRVGRELFAHSRLTAKSLPGPCSVGDGRDGKKSRATIIAFRIITDIHSMQPLHGYAEFVPARLFQTQQHVYPDSPDHIAFARQVQDELGEIFDPDSPKRNEPKSPTAFGGNGRFSFVAERFPGRRAKAPGPKSLAEVSRRSIDTSPSEKNLVQPSTPPEAAFSGVHVLNEISVDVTELRNQSSGTVGQASSDVEMMELGVRTEISAPGERETMVDELMSMTLVPRMRS